MEASDQAQAWVQEISSSGRVEIGTVRRKYLVQFGLPILIVVVFFGFGFLSGNINTVPLIFGIMVVPLMLIGIALYLSRSHGGKSIVIDQSGFTTMDGQFIPWHDVEKSDIFRTSRSEPTVRVMVSEAAWTNYLSRRRGLSKVLHKFNTAVTRKRGIYLPHQLDADNDNLVELINFFAQANPDR